MGYYIQTPEPKNKVAQILASIDGARTELHPFFDPSGARVGVCIADNGQFEAAGLIFDQEECDEFSRFDGRPKTWLSIPREAAIRACPCVERYLPPLAT